MIAYAGRCAGAEALVRRIERRAAARIAARGGWASRWLALGDARRGGGRAGGRMAHAVGGGGARGAGVVRGAAGDVPDGGAGPEVRVDLVVNRVAPRGPAVWSPWPLWPFIESSLRAQASALVGWRADDVAADVRPPREYASASDQLGPGGGPGTGRPSPSRGVPAVDVFAEIERLRAARNAARGSARPGRGAAPSRRG